MDDLEDWTTPIRNLQKNFATRSTPTAPGGVSIHQELHKLGITVASNAGADSLILQQQLVALNRIFSHTNVANVHNVLANIERVAFGAVWFAKDGWGAAEDTVALKELMNV